ncbi:MAG TPA: FMN-binding negative transcriptional regulator [Alloacidobacterium sp.]|nr:FMN-binding negative transcriptional regulator [Alloacidobacterium sp.]
MFVRPCWRPSSVQDAIELIGKNPWALLVSNGAHGPVATNLPLLFDYKRSDKTVLIGHIARANEHAALLSDASAPMLAIFEGPYSYVTASWYPLRDMPSTYYYTAVHCYGRVVLQDEPKLDESVERLTQVMEASIAGGWKTSEIEREAITRRYKSILGFELHIDRLEAKFKLGQDEPLKDALAVAEQLEQRFGNDDLELASMIRKQNAGREG